MIDKHPNAPRGHIVHEDWPSWRYGPSNESKICYSADDVPEGWTDHPGKVGEVATRTANGEPTRKEMLAAAAARGITVKGNISNVALRELFSEQPSADLNGDPDALDPEDELADEGDDE